MAQAARWLRRNLFASAWSTLLTLLVLGLLALVLPPLVRWAVTKATVWGESRQACAPDGACWAFVRARLGSFIYGRYPVGERWRVALAAALLGLLAVPVLRDQTRHRGLWLVALIGAYPIVAGILLVGGVLGLAYVPTNNWGGLMLNVVLSFVAIAGSIPLGIVLALGRRSELPLVRWFSIGFIELWRGVPLLTVLFTAAVMLPLFLPSGVTLDSLIRAMVALTLFTSAYMAEVVRGGLQGVPAGQEEAALSLGLGWGQTQRDIVLPQALRLVVPGIVNTVVDLFKDTTLVSIVGLFDLQGTIAQSLKDQAWLGLAREGYAFAALVFFACCFSMSLYSRGLERRLNAGTRRR